MRTVEEIQKQIDETTATRESVAESLRNGGFSECLSNMVDRINHRLRELYQEKKDAENPPPVAEPVPTRYDREWVI